MLIIADHAAGDDRSSAFAEVCGNEILCADDCFRKISLVAAVGQEPPLIVPLDRPFGRPVCSETGQMGRKQKRLPRFCEDQESC